MESKSGARARDVDRNEVIETLQNAYVEGQLDSDERERRTALALAATHMSELSGLTRDLQGVPTKVTGTPTPPRRSKIGLVIGALVAVPVLVTAVLFLGPSDDQAPAAQSPPGQVDPDKQTDTDQPFVMWSDVKSTLPRASNPERQLRIEGVGRWSPTEDNLTAFLARYQAGNGTTYFDSLNIYPQYVSINRPVTGSRPTMQGWSLYSDDDSVSIAEPASVNQRDMRLMDLNDLDIKKLYDNIDFALKNLDAPESKLLYASISFFADKPHVSIYVQDPYDSTATGYITTTLAGKILDEHGVQ